MKLLFTALFCCFLCTPVFGQFNFDEAFKGRRKIDIPFQLDNNFIIIDVRLNTFLNVKFIFDTGSEHSIITKKEITDLLKVNYEKRLKVYGADLDQHLFAYLAKGLTLQFDEMLFNQQNLLVLEDDYFQFEKYTGVEVHGILGVNMFRPFVVKIDYKKQVISLIHPQRFKLPKKGYQDIDLTLIKGKPHIKSQLTLAHGDVLDLNFLIDTGASLALLIYSDTDEKLKAPDNAIQGPLGAGLGGLIEGFIGKIPKINLANFELNQVLCHYHKTSARADSLKLRHAVQKNGIIGGQILKRFTVILDFPRNNVYFKPNKRFKESFDYDRSGIVVLASGKKLRDFVVQEVLDDSPAAEAGIKPGDLFLKVNWRPAYLLNLGNINRIFQGRTGRVIRVSVVRGGKKLKYRLKLRDLL